MKAKEVIEVLRKHHEPLGREWAFIEELRAGTGYKSNESSYNPERRFDAYALNLYPSKYKAIVYEVKVSRSDFFNEIKNPDKRKEALMMSNYYYFVVPKGLVKTEEVPDECGLIEVVKTEEKPYLMFVKKAQFRFLNIDLRLISSIARRCTIAEEATVILKQEKYESMN